MTTEMVLPQLVEAESKLAAQETALAQQLAELREKMKGLQTVIGMFKPSADANGQSVAVVADLVSQLTATEPKSALAEPEDEDEDEELDEEDLAVVPAAEAPRAPKTGRGGRPRKSTTLARTPAPKAVEKAPRAPLSAKQPGRAANWQRYVREDFSKTPLPDVVENILKAQPKHSFKIADVMSEIFQDDIPKNHFLKARNRISNILSAGARNGDWYRGRGGTYSCSAKAFKSS